MVLINLLPQKLHITLELGIDPSKNVTPFQNWEKSPFRLTFVEVCLQSHDKQSKTEGRRDKQIKRCTDEASSEPPL